MARPREFDQGQVVQQALGVFWHKGYQGTSLNELLEATELSKSSLYESFGSKRALAVEALRHYGRMLFDGPLAALLADGAGRAEIERTLLAIAAAAATPDGQRGCFANNCLAEIAPHDPEVAAAAQAVRRKVEDAFAAAVRRGQQAGAIRGNESARALARFLVGVLAGLNVAAKARPGRAVLHDIARVALRALD